MGQSCRYFGVSAWSRPEVRSSIMQLDGMDACMIASFYVLGSVPGRGLW